MNIHLGFFFFLYSFPSLNPQLLIQVLQIRKLIFKCIKYWAQVLTARKQINRAWTEVLLYPSLCLSHNTGKWIMNKSDLIYFQCLLKMCFLKILHSLSKFTGSLLTSCPLAVITVYSPLGLYSPLVMFYCY